MTRQRQCLSAERYISSSKIARKWPAVYKPNGPVISDLGNAPLRADYIDIIPTSWLVLSISLSECHDEIWVSRARSGQSPFVLRLPFKREHSVDDSDDTLEFEETKKDMLEIIKLANESAHSAGDLSRKGAKTEWWETRFSLDTRLKDLLTNIENVWFGGFKGIFSSQNSGQNLLARFRKAFDRILDKHLPSRQRCNALQQLSRTSFSASVLELFLACSIATDAEEIDDQLLDLLYFVVDILQFNGERNAYDEVDFDAVW